MSLVFNGVIEEKSCVELSKEQYATQNSVTPRPYSHMERDEDELGISLFYHICHETSHATAMACMTRIRMKRSISSRLWSSRISLFCFVCWIGSSTLLGSRWQSKPLFQSEKNNRESTALNVWVLSQFWQAVGSVDDQGIHDPGSLLHPFFQRGWLEDSSGFSVWKVCHTTVDNKVVGFINFKTQSLHFDNAPPPTSTL